MPWNFRAIPDTERIEGMEKQAAQEFFSKHIGVSTVSNDAFSIKACRMPFREPKPREVPPFVQKAILEYEYATLRYSQDLLEYEQFRQAQSRQDEKQESTLIPKPIPPTKPLFVIQHELRNVREYPDSVDAPHPAFRVTFILSKKQISKLAIHRNFVRKKLAAAAEMVFRGHARQGYEFMVFAKKPSMTTPQGKLVELMKEALTNPFLYGERLSQRSDSGKNSNGSNSNSNSNNSTTMQDINDNIQESLTATAATAASAAAAASNPHVVTVRWKNNRPSAHRLWWKRAIPNPLGRVQQTDEYLDRFCPKVELTRSSSKTSISTSEQKNIKTAKKADSKANETR
ncbi:hypothetical protein BGX27_003678 [Mortierella sp. AM989]|nr:hypothetical protein BGX27_003678 [Mortierella sp. AM989]